MYPVEVRPPSPHSIPLNYVQDIEELRRQNVTGHLIRAMACDPYKHPVFAISDPKGGGVLIYDAEEEQVLRRVGASRHTVESVTFNAEHHFVMSSDTGQHRKVIVYNIKGEKLSEVVYEDIVKLYSIAMLPDNRVAVTCETDTHKHLLRIYHLGGDTVLHSIENDENGNPYFSKPAYMVATGERLVVGDVGTKSLRCFSSSPKNKDPLLWTHKMDMPRGMCTDGVGNICACDFRNSRMTLLTAEGKLLGHSLTDLSNPQFAAITGNLLYILDQCKSTTYRLTTFKLYRTQRRRSKNKPDWKK